MVRPRQVRTLNERELADRTVDRQPAHLDSAARTGISFSCGLRVTGAVANVVFGGERTAGEAHHEQAGSVLLGGAGDGRSGGGEEELLQVHLVYGDAVVAVVVVCSLAELGADGDLAGEADDGDADSVGYQVVDSVMDVARVDRDEGPVDYQYFARGM